MINEKKLKKFLESLIEWKGASGPNIQRLLQDDLKKVFKEMKEDLKEIKKRLK